jgi:hypothetical protein
VSDKRHIYAAHLGRLAADPDQRRRWEKYLWLFLVAVWLFFNVFGFFRNMWWWAFDDQADTGTLATGLVEGLATSPWWYQNSHETGSLVFGVLLYPVYALAGSSFLWLKILSFAAVAGGFFFWTAALRRAWGPTAAVIFFLWLLFPPPFLEWHVHQCWAQHVESFFFSGLLVFLFVRLHDSLPRFWESLALGLSAGFASFFCMDNLLIAGALAAIAVWRWRRPGLVRLLWPTALGFLATFSPSRFSPVLPVPSHEIWSFFHPSALLECGRRWTDLVLRALPNCAGYRGAAGAWMSAAWLLLVGLGVGRVLWNARTAKAKPEGPDWLAAVLLLQLLFFALAVGMSNHQVEFGAGSDLDFYLSRRYLLIVFPALLALASAFLARSRGPWKWLLMAPFLVAGCANLTSGVDFRGGALAAKYHGLRIRRGDDYHRFVYAALPLSWRNQRDALASVARLPRRWRDEGYESVGLWRPLGETLEAAANDGGLAVDARRGLAAGAGRGLVQHGRADRRLEGYSEADAAAIFALVNALDKPLALSFAMGLGREIQAREAVGASATDLASWARSLLPQLTAAELFRCFVRGYGVWLGLTIHSFDEPAKMRKIAVYERAFGAEFDDDGKAAVADGLAAGRAISVANDFTRFVYDYPPADFPAFRDALERLGIRLRPTVGVANEYVLVIGQ